MNSKQRIKNRNTAALNRPEPICPECGARGRHWIGMPMTIESLVKGIPPEGFWTCDKFYDKTGRRSMP